MNKGNLQTIMNSMVRRFETIKTEGANSYQTDPWTEIKAYIGLDPLLGDLHKQYLDARSYHKRLLRENGKDDAMTDIALDARSSAVSAIETRVLELKKDEALRSVVAYRLRKAELAKGTELSAGTKEYWHKIRGYNEAQAHAGQKRSEGEEDFFMAAMFLFVMDKMLQKARRNLSIASVFDAARNAQDYKRQRAAA